MYHHSNPDSNLNSKQLFPSSSSNVLKSSSISNNSHLVPSQSDPIHSSHASCSLIVMTNANSSTNKKRLVNLLEKSVHTVAHAIRPHLSQTQCETNENNNTSNIKNERNNKNNSKLQRASTSTSFFFPRRRLFLGGKSVSLITNNNNSNLSSSTNKSAILKRQQLSLGESFDKEVEEEKEEGSNSTLHRLGNQPSTDIYPDSSLLSLSDDSSSSMQQQQPKHHPIPSVQYSTLSASLSSKFKHVNNKETISEINDDNKTREEKEQESKANTKILNNKSLIEEDKNRALKTTAQIFLPLQSHTISKPCAESIALALLSTSKKSKKHEKQTSLFLSSDNENSHTYNSSNDNQHCKNVFPAAQEKKSSQSSASTGSTFLPPAAASSLLALNGGADYDEEDFMEAFRIFDTNGDGRITAKELNHVLKDLGITMEKKEIKKMIKELDNDGNGTIEYSEFVAMMTMPASRETDEYELREAFRCIDLDGNGFISREELMDAVQKIMSHDTNSNIGLQDIEEMMNEADQDGNGVIDFDEFVRVLVEKRT